MPLIGARRALLSRSAIIASGGGLVYTPTDAKNAAPGYATSGNWTGVNIGTPSADRIVIIGLAFDNTGTMGTAPTIGGVTATLAAGNGTGGGPNSTGIWYANVPTGTTATVAWSGATSGVAAIGLVVGTIYGQSGGGSAAPNHAGFSLANQAQPLGPLAITVSAGGIAFLTGAGNFPTAAPTYTWTGTNSPSGDETTFNISGNAIQIGSSNASASGNVTVSSSQSLSYTGVTYGILYAAWAS